MRLTPQQEEVYVRFAELALPRHTSYPTVPHWSAEWGSADYAHALGELGQSRQELGLYLHVPFCRKLCAYCACTREIVPDEVRAVQDPAQDFLAGLRLEARRVTRCLGKRVIHELHLGGGTPTFLTPAQLARLFEVVSAHFCLAPDADIAAEVDPRVTTSQHLRTLRGLGVTRLSLGVQDFDPAVQEAVGREQSVSQVRRVVDEARAVGFTSINFDLIYALPRQTPETLRGTLDAVLELGPDRLSFFRLAVLPDLFKWQRGLTRADLPQGVASLRLMEYAAQRFAEAGYLFLGLDSFVKPTDSLAAAWRRGELARNFQGTTAARGRAVVGLGPSAITQGAGFYSQNAKTTKAWLAALSNGFAAVRGLKLTARDQAQRAVIERLYSDGCVDFDAAAAALEATRAAYVAPRHAAWRALAADGVIELRSDGVALTPDLGRLLVRVVAATLDEYLPEDAWARGLPPGAASAVG